MISMQIPVSVTSQVLMSSLQGAAHVQVLDFLVILAGIQMLPMDQVYDFYSDPALRKHAIGDIWRSMVRDLREGFEHVARLCHKPNHAHVLPQTVLSLAWPRYLEELAASRTPITQVHSPSCM